MNFEYGPADQEALERRNARAAAAVQMEQSLTPVALQHLEEQLRHPPLPPCRRRWTGTTCKP